MYSAFCKDMAVADKKLFCEIGEWSCVQYCDLSSLLKIDFGPLRKIGSSDYK
jgi:hypothetical protein